MSTVQKPCRECGGKGAHNRDLCRPCAHKLGICVQCAFKPQDRPGFKVCSRCEEDKLRERDRIFARTGRWGIIPEWKIRQIEEDRKSVAEVLAMYERDAIHG